MHSGGLDVVLKQLCDHVVNAQFGSAEDQALVRAPTDVALDPQDRFEQFIELVGSLLQEDHGLRDGPASRQPVAAHADGHRLEAHGGCAVLLSHLLHLHRPRCGEHEHLPVRPHLAQDEPHLPREVLFEHHICLVEDHKGHPVQVRPLLVQQLDEPAGSRDDDVVLLLQGHALRLDGHAAKNTSAPQADRRSKELAHAIDLLSQFSRRAHDQANRAFPGLQLFLGHDVDDHWDQICQGLARARLRDADQVAALHGRGPDLHLDRCRGNELLVVVENIQHPIGQGGLLESGDGLRGRPMSTQHFYVPLFADDLVLLVGPV
mmetsp:Transcript_63893/g.183533  ORF Transcript_63893/g.183533 Transcript_63893/m.183533 type:complete len:319 (-) Transcript_63893:147-1103(-)